MATERAKQLNVRLEGEYWDLIDRLAPLISDQVGLKMTAADVVRLGLKCLAKRHIPDGPPLADEQPAPPAKKKSKGK